ncbi:CU044_2847 family protein [Streptomyces sp. ISL-86]|uniref:CU044_2847 family protein n=1 Tax=Streptomyces sp. ISL-86 TaxID=2819187 RepID=UPI0027E50346|nr:CU044_2847 family protein [Streptomyces sp. ISL-86]
MELSEGQGSGVIRASRGEGLVESSADTFESGLARVRHVAEALLERLADLPRRPDHIRAEFGIKVTAEAGLSWPRLPAMRISPWNWSGVATRATSELVAGQAERLGLGAGGGGGGHAYSTADVRSGSRSGPLRVISGWACRPRAGRRHGRPGPSSYAAELHHFSRRLGVPT